MKTGPARQVLQSFFGLERRETITRFLYAIIISVIVLDTIMIVIRRWDTTTASATTPVLIVLLLLQFFLLALVRLGYVDPAAYILVIGSWIVVTYLIWSADGVRDVALYLYFVILLIAALITNWRLIFILALLSISFIWFLAIGELQGLRTPHFDAPLSVARDLTAIFILLVILIYLVVHSVARSLDAVREGEKKYRNFVEKSIEGIWYLAFDQPIPTRLSVNDQVELIYERGYIAECNDVLAQMYGFPSSDDLRGVHMLGLQSGMPFYAMKKEVIWELVNANYRYANLESVEIDRQGQTVYFLNNSVGVIQDDYLIGLWGTKLDVSAQKRTEEALRNSEARMRALLNAVPDMIFEFSRDGRILQFIPSTINAPLLPPEQFLGKTIAQVLPSLSDRTLFAISRVLESGDVNAFEYELLQDGKQRTFEARITPIGPDTVLAMVRDVSLQKWIEEEREKLIVELEQKNAELERFTYTVSHDLKSPLITIRGFLGFIREDSRKGDLRRLDADIKRIGAATEKMQALLNDLLELSRVGRLMNEPRDINFNELVKETLELLHGRISQAEVSISVQDNLPTVHGDYARLLEVLQNLIDNACKFMGDRTSPYIEIGHQGFDNSMPVFYVRDNGIGIQLQFYDNIFGLFNKLDAHSEGTGVGLTLVKRIIEFHGGRIWIESEPSNGTTFFFTLPQGPKES